MVEEIRQLHTALNRIIFAAHMMTAEIFISFRLGKEGVQPIGALYISRLWLVKHFTACTQMGVKDSILASFCRPTATLRVVVATIAFGKGP